MGDWDGGEGGESGKSKPNSAHNKTVASRKLGCETSDVGGVRRLKSGDYKKKGEQGQTKAGLRQINTWGRLTRKAVQPRS